MKTFKVLDSTLRDGAQAEGISFSVSDKINIALALDSLGVAYIEAGNPASNPKDVEFFKEMENRPLKNAVLAAFGSTRRKGVKAEDDAGLIALASAGTPAVSIFGKAWDFHATEILKAGLEENLAMISDTVAFLKTCGKEVIFDAEHFFDGYKHNPDYALKTLKAAKNAGADVICLCDTNGGCFPHEITAIVTSVKKEIKAEIGIHTHDDTGCAVANTVAAVLAGAGHVQGTLIGYGERCGNANLSAVIPDLQLKLGITGITGDIKDITEICRRVAEISNVRLNRGAPYVGKSAFTHKAGMHIDGVYKDSKSFEHVSPEAVGNERRFLMSEVAGRSTVADKIKRIDPTVTRDNPVTARIIERIKELEFIGYQFEGADASFELLVRKQLGTYKPFFALEKFKTIGEQRVGGDYAPAAAMVKVTVNGESEVTAAEGNGPVNALDVALRKALESFYPSLKEFRLTDYKVRILDGKETSSSVTRVLIESCDKSDTWTTVGVSRDIIEASLIALTDAIEYKLIKDREEVL